MNRERTHGRVLPPPAHLLSYSPPSTRVSPAEREGCARLTRMEGMERVDEENDSGEITYEPPLFIPASVPRFVTLTSVPSAARSDGTERKARRGRGETWKQRTE